MHNMAIEKAEETEMDVETAIRRDMSAIMVALSRRNCTMEELASARAKVAEASAILMKAVETKA